MCVCVCVSWAIWMSHAFHVPPNDDDQNLWLSYMPHCRKPLLCLCFHTVLFRRPKLQIGRSEVAWVDAETETQNRHLQHGITYKFRMHDFALFWYLSNTCALNEVEVAVADGDEDGDEAMLPLNDHAEHEKHERSQRRRRRLLDLSKHIQISCQNWHRQPSCGLLAWETDRQADRQVDKPRGWQSQAPAEDAFNASVTLQQLHRYLRLAVSIKEKTVQSIAKINMM